jgi:hypothetical protein
MFDVIMPNKNERDFREVSVTACWGVDNWKDLFGLARDKDAFSEVFKASICNNTKSPLIGSS